MAQEIQVILKDDLDGSTENVETVKYGLDGIEYEIDLGQFNADDLRQHLEKYVPYSRRTGGRKARNTPQSRPSKDQKQRLQNIREWAKENGHKVSERGRISQDIVDAYDEANA